MLTRTNIDRFRILFIGNFVSESDKMDRHNGHMFPFYLLSHSIMYELHEWSNNESKKSDIKI